MDDDRHNVADGTAELATLRARLVAMEQQMRGATALTTTRLAHLQSLTAALGATLTAHQAATAVITQAIPAVGASGGDLALLSADTMSLHTIHASGYAPEIVARWRDFTLDEPVPAATAVRERAPVWLRSRQEWATQFPQHAATQAHTQAQALATLPLLADNRVLGVLTLGFAIPQPFDTVDRAFIETLAQQCAQAIERVHLYTAERQNREQAETQRQQLQLFSEVSTALAASLDYPTTLSRIVRLMLPALGDCCLLDLVEAGSVRQVAGAHVDPVQDQLVQQMLLRADVARDNPHSPIAAMLREGSVQISNELTDATLAAAAYTDPHMRLIRALAPTAFMIVPLRVRDQILGALTCVMAGSNRRYGAEERALAEELAGRAGRAIAHAQTYQRMQEEIAQRQRAEQELRESQARLAGMVDSAMDAIISIDAAQHIVVFNAAAEQMFGCPAAMALGQPIDRFVPLRFRGVHAAHIRAFGQTGSTSRSMGSPGTLAALRADGTEFPIEATIAQTMAAGQPLYTVIMRDITKRTHAEQALHRSTDRLRVLADASRVFAEVGTGYQAVLDQVMVRNPPSSSITGWEQVAVHGPARVCSPVWPLDA